MASLLLNHVLIDGAIGSLIVGGVLIAITLINPRILIDDFPKEVQARIPPLTNQEKRLRTISTVLFLGSMVVVFLVSDQRLKTDNGGSLPFVVAYVSTYLLFLFFNLFDLIVIDYLIICVWKPKFTIVPGSEGLEHLYQNFAYHFKAFLKGLVIGLVMSLPIAALATIL